MKKKLANQTIYSTSDNNGTYLCTDKEMFRIDDEGLVTWPCGSRGRMLYVSGGHCFPVDFDDEDEADAMLWLLGIDPPATREVMA